MTAAELIEALRAFPQDAPVLSQSGDCDDVYEVHPALGWARLVQHVACDPYWDTASKDEKDPKPAVWL